MFNSQEDYDNFIDDIADRTVAKLRSLLCPQDNAQTNLVNIKVTTPKFHYMCRAVDLNEEALDRAANRTGNTVKQMNYNVDMKPRPSLWACEADLSEFWKAYREECSK